MESNKYFVGTWEILGYRAKDETPFDFVDLAGVSFRLDDNGDVTWNVPENVQDCPWFACEIYEIFNLDDIEYVLRFGTYHGHILEFKCYEDLMIDGMYMKLKEGYTFQCKKVEDEPCLKQEIRKNTTFSLLPALQEKFFSDLTLTSNDDVQHNCHSVIVNLLAKDIPWACVQTFAQKQGCVIENLLYYLYTESLPDTLVESDCIALINLGKEYLCLSGLVEKCELYMKKLALSQNISELMVDTLTYIGNVIARFENLQKDPRRKSPSELCNVVKQSIKDAIAASAKLVLFCDLYAKRKSDLTKSEQNQVIRITKHHLPIFMNQIRKLFKIISVSFTSLKVEEKEELAKHLVPEYEDILHKGSKVIQAIAKAIQDIIQSFSPHHHTNKTSPHRNSLKHCLSHILRTREMRILEELHDHISCGFDLILRKSDYFRGMSEDFKVRSVVYTINEIIEELPIFVLRFEKVIDALDDKLEWRDYKFCFKVGTGRVAGILQKTLRHRTRLESLFCNLAKLVNREDFTQTLANLGLLSRQTCLLLKHGVETKDDCLKPLQKVLPDDALNATQFNLLRNFCKSPAPSESLLSKKCLELFLNEIEADMEFEVISVGSGSLDESSEENFKFESHTFRAHRIVMAARCYWFRRALLSDMREAIDKKIVIHDTNPNVFKIFLEYLYSGCLVSDDLIIEQFVELLLLSDRYEVDCLKQICEHDLETYLDEESVLYLLNVADQCNAKVLKNSCINFLMQNKEIIDSDIFLELPIALQNEVFDQMWSYPLTPSARKHGAFLKRPASTKTSLSNGSVDFSSTAETRRFDDCMLQLRDIVGASVSEEELIRVSRAADYDVFKAIDVFYERGRVD